MRMNCWIDLNLLNECGKGVQVYLCSAGYALGMLREEWSDKTLKWYDFKRFVKVEIDAPALMASLIDELMPLEVGNISALG